MRMGRKDESAYQVSVMFLIGWISLCIMSILDLLLTLRLHAHDALDEMNPIASGFFSLHPAYVVLLKVFSLAIFSIVLQMLAVKSYRTAVKVLIAANVILTFVMIQH